jgi:hypothetical protein
MSYLKKAMVCSVLLSCITFAVIAQKSGLPENPLFARKYKPGEDYRYKITMSEYHNGEFAFTNVAVCELKVVYVAGVPYDEVHWLSKKLITAKDTTDQTAKAILVKPYRISLSGKGRIDLPRIDIAEMTEPIQDFNTFFVGVSPLIQGMDKIKNSGDSTTTKDPIIADFSNGTFILKGQDCLDITMKLVNTTKTEAILYTSFAPPKHNKLAYLLPDMNTPVFEHIPNNFQMVAPAGKDLFMVNYGREYFYINSTVRKLDGKIVKADMFNQLNLKIKVNCNSEYKNCQVEIPFAEQRKLTLELL